jgi:hypothetical protein
MNKNFYNSEYLAKSWVATPLLGLCLAISSGCSTTQKVDIKQTEVNCAFLEKDCSMLTVGGKEQTGLRYVNARAKWTQYNKIMIDPVTYWGGDVTTITTADQQMLVNYFFEQLKEQLGAKYEIVTQPGVGVMKLDVALIDAETATPVLRSISMIIPQAHLLSNLKYLATGTLPFVGAAQAEAKLSDSSTGEILFLAVDKQIGGGAFTNGFQWQWGDAEHAIDHWAELAATKLSDLTSGKVIPQ